MWIAFDLEAGGGGGVRLRVDLNKHSANTRQWEIIHYKHYTIQLLYEYLGMLFSLCIFHQIVSFSMKL